MYSLSSFNEEPLYLGDGGSLHMINEGMGYQNGN